jgi:Zn-dependent M28 family amino/carboxypeptidase
VRALVSRLLLHDTRTARPARVPAGLAELLVRVRPEQLRADVEHLSSPRSRTHEPEANAAARQWIAAELTRAGYEIEVQGPYRNVIAVPRTGLARDFTLVGAHYDSVPGSPGADDNASGVAAMLTCARLLAEASSSPRQVLFVAFNGEEENLLGSTDFVANWLPTRRERCIQAHILEMLGCTAPTQRVPGALPLDLPPTGHFVGWLFDPGSKKTMSQMRALCAACTPGLHGLGLHVHARLAARIADLLRSDHAPLWRQKIPAVLWTDTADFRNERYHTAQDTPDSLDYSFLTEVTRLLLATLYTSLFS